MRRIILSMTLVLALVASAFAGPQIKQYVPFSNVSGASAAVKVSPAYNAVGFPNKTLHVSGVTLGSSLSSITFKNMSGTLIAQCGPTTNGPWDGAGRWQDSVGTAVSATANGTQTWRDVCNYVRLQWTSGTVGGKLKAWLNLSE